MKLTIKEHNEPKELTWRDLKQGTWFMFRNQPDSIRLRVEKGYVCGHGMYWNDACVNSPVIPLEIEEVIARKKVMK